jgi:hypothetical protein
MALQHQWIRDHTCGVVLPAINTTVVERMRAYAQAPRLLRAYWACATRTSASSTDHGPLREQFLSLAAEGRGTIGLGELQEVLGSTCGSDVDDITAIFEGLDLTASGEISFSEFLAAASFDPAETQGDVFRRFDSSDAETISSLLDCNMAEPWASQISTATATATANPQEGSDGDVAEPRCTGRTATGQPSRLDPSLPLPEQIRESLSSVLHAVEHKWFFVADVLGIFDGVAPSGSPCAAAVHL